MQLGQNCEKHKQELYILQTQGMAVTIDIGDAFDIHPKNKQEVGEDVWH